MWDQSYDQGGGGGGGFVSTQGGATPGGGADGGKKRQRANNIVPVRISDVLDSQGEVLTVEGQEVGMVVLVGQVVSVDHAATKSVYRIRDRSEREIECVHWVDEGSDKSSANVAENMYCRVVGAVRVNQDKRTVMVFKISQLSSAAGGPSVEVEAHELEVAHARLKIRQYREKENASIGANPGGGGAGLSNSMMGGFANSNAGGSSSSSSTFGNPKHDQVYRLISACDREAGLSRDEIESQLKSKGMSKADVDAAVDFLSSEGHVYSTVDDDHFKAIEG